MYAIARVIDSLGEEFNIHGYMRAYIRNTFAETRIIIINNIIISNVRKEGNLMLYTNKDSPNRIPMP